MMKTIQQRIQDLESSNQELQATVVQLEAISYSSKSRIKDLDLINEELEAKVGELEARAEEFEAINEEFKIENVELKQLIDELHRKNNWLSNEINGQFSIIQRQAGKIKLIESQLHIITSFVHHKY